MNINKELKNIGLEITPKKKPDLIVKSPIDGLEITRLSSDKTSDIELKIKNSLSAFKEWRDVPAPKRGELIRLYGEELRKHKKDLARLVTIECGKIIEEGSGEIQEMIDICDFAVGLSRQLHGLTIASERHNHVMQENWLPLGPVLVISAFNFPAAVWAWNFALAIVCGDSVIWKPSEKTPVTALACNAVFEKVAEKFGAPENLSQLVISNPYVAEKLIDDKRVALVSATGSTRMGSIVAPKVAARFGKTLLELGGNNAVIVSDKADLDIAVPSVIFGAVGTAGQRCTTTRRVIAHKSIYDELFKKLKKVYDGIIKTKIGNPLDKNTLLGPLIDEKSYKAMQDAIDVAKRQGGEVYFGNRIQIMAEKYPAAYYVEPVLVKMKKQTDIVFKETFAPITYIIPYEKLEEAVEMNNAVPQGLSSAIFTTDLREAEYFKKYSDTGICNINIGTSGAEIGGAFGGEKETGGGREAGSDSWKNYMRRQTSTTYYGAEKPELAQGIKFGE